MDDCKESNSRRLLDRNYINHGKRVFKNSDRKVVSSKQKSNVPREPFEGNNDEKGTKKKELERKHGQPIQDDGTTWFVKAGQKI